MTEKIEWEKLQMEPCSYRVSGIPGLDEDELHGDVVTIEYRGSGRWGVYHGRANVLYKGTGLFMLEGLPSSRTEKILEATRFDSPEAALQFLYDSLNNPIKIRGKALLQQITGKPQGEGNRYISITAALESKS